MRRPHIEWRLLVLAVALAIPALFAHSSEAHAASDLVYEGPFAAGGSIRLTLTADRAGITSLELIDVPFSIPGCGAYVASVSAYYDPPRAIVNGDFEVHAFFGDPHHSRAYALVGNVLSESRVEGIVRANAFDAGSACNNSSEDVAWSADLVAAPDHAQDLKFFGGFAAGDIVVYTNQARTTITAVHLLNTHLPCLTSPPFTVIAEFDPPLGPNEVNLFLVDLTAFVGDPPTRLLLSLPISIPAPDLVGGYISAGAGSGCDPPYPEPLWWTASLQVEPPPTPQPTAVALPSTGAQPSGDASAVLPLLLLAAGAAFGAAALILRRR